VRSSDRLSVAALRAIGIGDSRHQISTENLKVDRRQKSLKMIAEIAQLFQAFVNVKKNRDWPPVDSSPIPPTNRTESETPPIGEVLRSAQLARAGFNLGEVDRDCRSGDNCALYEQVSIT
jgi:hypothetical protein